MVQNILDKINVEALTEEERVFVTKTLQKAHEQQVKKAKEKAAKLIENEEIISVMDDLLEKNGQFIASEVFEALGGKFTIQRVSYVARELANVKATDNPLYAVKVYTRA